MFNHSISDLLSRIRNGYLAQREVINSPMSKMRERVLQLLKDEGYILNFTKSGEGAKAELAINLKYIGHSPALQEIEVVSKPGKRVYCTVDNIPSVRNGLGMVILSTSSGILPDYEAKQKKVGGEILFKIF